MGRDIVGQNSVGCYMYMLCPFAHPVECCYLLLGVVVQSLKLVKLLNQQLLTCLFFRDRLKVALRCWIRLHKMLEPRTCIVHGFQILIGRILPTMHCTPNIVGPTMLGVFVFVCT